MEKKKNGGKKPVKKKRRQHSLLLVISAGVLMSVAAGLLLLSYLSVVANPAKVWFFSIFGLLYFPFMLLNLVLLVWAIARRSPLAAIPLLAILPSLLFVGRYVRFTGASDGGNVPESSERLKIVTWNLDRFAYRRDRMEADACADSVFSWLREQDADIICLQEYATRKPSSLRRLVAKKLPGYSAEYYLIKTGGRYCGNMTLSRIPALSKGKLLFEDSSNLAIYSDYLIGGRKFRIYNCHFESYAISMSSIWKAVTGDRESFQTTGHKYRRSIVRRPKQVSDVLSHIEESPVESVVCGDFNDNPMSYTYHRIGRGRKDTFVEAGSGFGASYSAFWPMLRIDYVFVPEDWTPTGHKTRRIRLSDHFPVVAEVAI